MAYHTMPSSSTPRLYAERRGKCEKTTEARYARRTVQMLQAKAAYYTAWNDKNKGNSKTIFKLTNSLMGENGEIILPTHSCDKTLADQFLSFFHNKTVALLTEIIRSRCSLI